MAVGSAHPFPGRSTRSDRNDRRRSRSRRRRRRGRCRPGARRRRGRATARGGQGGPTVPDRRARGGRRRGRSPVEWAGRCGGAHGVGPFVAGVRIRGGSRRRRQAVAARRRPGPSGMHDGRQPGVGARGVLRWSSRLDQADRQRAQDQVVPSMQSCAAGLPLPDLLVRIRTARPRVALDRLRRRLWAVGLVQRVVRGSAGRSAVTCAAVLRHSAGTRSTAL